MPTGFISYEEYVNMLTDFNQSQTNQPEANQSQTNQPEASRSKAKKAKPSLDLKRLKYELEDSLFYVLKGKNRILDSQYISMDRTIGDGPFAHTYQRREAEHRGMCYISFKRQTLALVTRKPHKTAVVYPQTGGQNSLARGMLLQLFYSSFPEVKVEEKR